jgi:N-acetylglucosaminyl-diphospho-decaprenol L-rhamnosyltransferase
MATVVTVTYKTEAVDLTWIPESAPILIVQNDSLFRADSVTHPNAKLIGTSTNVGFGAAVNEALLLVRTPRLILVNPDTKLTDEHWGHLSQAADDEVVVVPLNDAEGTPTSVVSAYPTPASLLLTALRVGRFIPRSSRARHVLAPLLGRWGRSHAASLTASCRAGRWPITTHWPVSAVCSYPTELVRAAGGFDPRYFLYLEDTDLARRLADGAPNLQVVVADVAPGTHLVGGSAADSQSRKRVQVEQARSATRYAGTQSGVLWKAAAAAAASIAWVEGR